MKLCGYRDTWVCPLCGESEYRLHIVQCKYKRAEKKCLIDTGINNGTGSYKYNKVYLKCKSVQHINMDRKGGNFSSTSNMVEVRTDEQIKIIWGSFIHGIISKHLCQKLNNNIKVLAGRDHTING